METPHEVVSYGERGHRYLQQIGRLVDPGNTAIRECICTMHMQCRPLYFCSNSTTRPYNGSNQNLELIAIVEAHV